MYFVKTPFWLKKLFNRYTWAIATTEKVLYLTFDDGPHPVATPFVLKQLENYKATASFFCLGKNVNAYPGIYADILEKGHTVGNHTYNHLNGWKVDNEVYVKNIEKASGVIRSGLFRPPYGRITRKAGRILLSKGFEIIMWDVLSGDFDQKILPGKCERNVTARAAPGSIIVFHDSEKAFKNLQHALPEVLKYFSEKGYVFRAIKTA